mmetsp:Transcript_7563/g.19230  ORF Transcript_7563/g.19230 Transcript_7563/m.19230 type:complete len:270 (+) Transcript_7563:1299-2108(+)
MPQLLVLRRRRGFRQWCAGRRRRQRAARCAGWRWRQREARTGLAGWWHCRWRWHRWSHRRRRWCIEDSGRCHGPEARRCSCRSRRRHRCRRCWWRHCRGRRNGGMVHGEAAATYVEWLCSNCRRGWRRWNAIWCLLHRRCSCRHPDVWACHWGGRRLAWSSPCRRSSTKWGHADLRDICCPRLGRGRTLWRRHWRRWQCCSRGLSVMSCCKSLGICAAAAATAAATAALEPAHYLLLRGPWSQVPGSRRPSGRCMCTKATVAARRRSNA